TPVQMSETNAARGYEKPQNDFGGKFAFYANFMTKSMCFILREVRSSEPDKGKRIAIRTL
ncbi:MAG: hypothetical protein ABIJ97_00750, partial [Bacteroidota bacterium]